MKCSEVPELTSDSDSDSAADRFADAVVCSTNVQSCCTSLYVVHRQKVAFLKLATVRQRLIVLQQHTVVSRTCTSRCQHSNDSTVCDCDCVFQQKALTWQSIGLHGYARYTEKLGLATCYSKEKLNVHTPSHGGSLPSPPFPSPSSPFPSFPYHILSLLLLFRPSPSLSSPSSPSPPFPSLPISLPFP